MASTDVQTIQTKFGAVNVTLTDANHAYLSANDDGITINQVEYHFGCHLYRWKDQSWHVGQEDKTEYERRQSLHMTRRNWTQYRESLPSKSAWKKAAEELLLAFIVFIVANPGEAVDAEREHLREVAEKAARAYAEAMQKADEALRVRDQAEEAFRLYVSTPEYNLHRARQ